MQLPDFLHGFWTERDILRNLVSSAVLLLAVVAGRALTIRSLVHFKERPLADPLRLKARTRWVALGIAVLGLTVIWADELRTLALSLVAIAAAVVIATKELIMCMSGALVRASGATFDVGDRIEVDGLRGDVIDHQLLTTTILEIGPGHQPTGRTVVLPNSVFLAARVYNETLTDNFVVHVVAVPLKSAGELPKHRDRLLSIANEVCEPFADDAARALDATAAKHGLPLNFPHPDVLVQAVAPEHVNLLLRVPVPARKRGEVEQTILRRFYAV
ncbi:MAG: mechanosensitive ion channel family protein [Myxococcales bacterium]|nr:mechanosensitive ion channel family protein [Myxococcales bacterium]